MIEITLRQLRYFGALSRHRHFGRAAEECAISQPALSMQILDLETKLGVALAERTPQGVLLTADGLEVAARVQTILGQVGDLAASFDRRGSLLSRSLRLGVIPSIAPYILPGLLPHLRRAYPELRLQLRESLTGLLLTELLDGELDFLLVALPIEAPGIETMGLLEDSFLLAVPRGYARSREPVTIEEVVRTDRLLLLEDGHCLRDQALASCNLRTSDVTSTFGVSSISTIVQMVSNGYGVTLLPELSLALETRHAEIETLRLAPPEPKRVVGLAWRASSPHKPDIAAFGRMILASLEGVREAS
jgi:LysR family hydrogen peroxide-inducible transcriptional activator